MSYKQQYSLAVIVAIALGMIGAVHVGNAELLGVTPRAIAWLGIISVGLGILEGFLPSVRGKGTDPEWLADRMWELPEPDHRRVIENLEARRKAQDAA